MQEIAVTIPDSVENLQLPTPELITYYTNLDRRVLWIDSVVDASHLENVKNILRWNREDVGLPPEQRTPIKLMFWTEGGSLMLCNTMIDMIKCSKTPVYGYNMGIAYSAGCLMFMACHKRFSLPSSSFLLHKGSAELGGDAVNVENSTADYKRAIANMLDFVVANSTIPKNVANKKMNADWYITAQEAKCKYGFVDEIITDVEMVV